MKSKITLHTRLNDGIHKSDGGGQDRIIQIWNLGPLNMLKAIGALHRERKSNKRGYGNIGCGRSWIEIDGQVFDETELHDEIQLEQFIREDGDYFRSPVSKMQIAKKYISAFNDA